MGNKRQRPADDIAVPDINDDPAERKRALNVLAQRRYRRRQREEREQLKALKAQLKGNTTSNGAESARSDPATMPAGRHQTPSSDGTTPSPVVNPLGTPEPTMDLAAGGGVATTSTNRSAAYLFPEGNSGIVPPDATKLSSAASISASDSEFGFLNATHFEDFTAPLFPSNVSLTSEDISSIDLSVLPPPNLDLMPTVSSSMDDMSTLAFEILGNSIPFNQLPTQDLSSSLQSHQSATFTFPDDHIIDVPPLTLLRAMLQVATRLNLTDHLWNMNGISPFYTGPGTLASSPSSPLSSTHRSDPVSSSASPNPSPSDPTTALDIPHHLRPTPTQRLIPHHALLDLLPWPTARDKLIQIFSIPVHLRPPAAADPMGMIGLVYDLEDPTGGLRVNGGDPFAPDMWEVGQHIFGRWWWAFEGSIVETSNRLRRQRGEQGLVLGSVD